MRLPTPELHVIMRDGETFDVQAFNVDLVAFDRDRAKHSWPLPADGPFLWMEYLAWHILTKTRGLLPAMTLREFGDKVATITSVEQNGDDELDAGVDPTNQAVEAT